MAPCALSLLETQNGLPRRTVSSVRAYQTNYQPSYTNGANGAAAYGATGTGGTRAALASTWVDMTPKQMPGPRSKQTETREHEPWTWRYSCSYSWPA
jgi:hypothetical protein